MKQNWDDDIETGRWEAFKDLPNKGWIDWNGGQPPLSTGDVDVRLRSGRLILYRGVVGIGGRKNDGGNWIHLGENSDIIAYRVHKSEIATGASDEGIGF